MKYEDLTKKELDLMMKVYVTERNNLYRLVSFEEFLERFVRRCNYCHNLFYDPEEQDKLECSECTEYFNNEEDDISKWEKEWNDRFNNYDED